MAKPSSKPNVLIKTLIREGDKPHALEVIFQGAKENMPIMTSVGCSKINGQWVSFLMKTKGDEVLSITELSEPDLKPIAVDGAKTLFGDHFMDSDPGEVALI